MSLTHLPALGTLILLLDRLVQLWCVSYLVPCLFFYDFYDYMIFIIQFDFYISNEAV